MPVRTDAPAWIAAILAWPWPLLLSRIALVSAFLSGGIQKLADFTGAIAERAHFGLGPAWLWAIAAIIVEIGDSALVILGILCLVWRRWPRRLHNGRDVCGERFWAKAGHDRFIAVNDFFEHLGLIAGLVLVSVLSLRMQGKRTS
jgi:uncharacterized membrane protein YphA (DoxX/SURF4 family)